MKRRSLLHSKSNKISVIRCGKLGGHITSKRLVTKLNLSEIKLVAYNLAFEKHSYIIQMLPEYKA